MSQEKDGWSIEARPTEDNRKELTTTAGWWMASFIINMFFMLISISKDKANSSLFFLVMSILASIGYILWYRGKDESKD